MKYVVKIDVSGNAESVWRLSDSATQVPDIFGAGDFVLSESPLNPGWHYYEGKFYRHWVQIEGAETGPEEAQSGYPEGAEIWHNGQAWVSTTGFNVWEPGVANWRPAGDAPAWIQPTGATDAYQIGDVVTHNGQTWESTHNANVWEPGVFGWVLA